MNFPPHKSQGRTVMTSDFIDVVDGFLEYDDEAWSEVKNLEEMKEEIASVGEARARRAGSILDVSKDGYYNTEICVTDFRKVGTNTQCHAPPQRIKILILPLFWRNKLRVINKKKDEVVTNS